MEPLRDTPGLPDPNIHHPRSPSRAIRSPTCASSISWRESRGTPVRLRDLVDRLNADYVDWSFTRPVVAAAVLQLQANWTTDYRTAEGIVIGSDAAGETVTIEDSSRVDPWIARQVERLAAQCRTRLHAFASEAGAIP